MEKKIKLKNYIYLILIILGSVGIVFYFYSWNKTYKENKLNSPIMTDVMQIINYNEIDNYVLENGNAYIYVSILNNNDIRLFENKFKNFIIKNNLNNKILYLDMTGIINDEDISNNLSSKYRINKKSILNVPCILSFSNGSLHDIYSINQNKFDSSEIKFYLKQEGLFE